MRKELPGDALEALRNEKGYEGAPGDFALSLNWSYQMLYNYETIRWRTDPVKWRVKTFPRRALDEIVESGWIDEGDDWYKRFEKALKLQAQVHALGPAAYDGIEPDMSMYERITRDNIREIVEVVVSRASEHAPLVRVAIQGDRAEVVRKALEEIFFIMDAVRMVIAEGSQGGIDFDDVTRGLVPVGAQGLSLAETYDTPLMRTLRFAHDWAVYFVEEERGPGVQAGGGNPSDDRT